MHDNKRKFAQALEGLEAEMGLEELAQLLSEALLSSTARISGDVQSQWSVNTDFVKGEVTTITDKALKKKSLTAPVVSPLQIAKYHRLLNVMDTVIMNDDTDVRVFSPNDENGFDEIKDMITSKIERDFDQGLNCDQFVIVNLDDKSDKIHLYITSLDIFALGQNSFFVATYSDDELAERKEQLNSDREDMVCSCCEKPLSDCDNQDFTMIDAFGFPQTSKPRIAVCTLKEDIDADGDKKDVLSITRYALVNLMSNANNFDLVWESYGLSPYHFEGVDYASNK